ncbi:hypothetical protein YC2023_118414 [Brassica napus]
MIKELESMPKVLHLTDNNCTIDSGLLHLELHIHQNFRLNLLLPFLQDSSKLKVLKLHQVLINHHFPLSVSCFQSFLSSSSSSFSLLFSSFSKSTTHK